MIRRSTRPVILLCILLAASSPVPTLPLARADIIGNDSPALIGPTILSALVGANYGMIPRITTGIKPANRTLCGSILAGLLNGFGSGDLPPNVQIINSCQGLRRGSGVQPSRTNLNSSSGGNVAASSRAKPAYYIGINPGSAADVLRPATGAPDVVIATGNQFWVVLNNGDGTFPASVTATRLSVPAVSVTDVAIGDITGDGKPDLVFTDLGNNAVIVLPGNGDGTFGAPISYSLGATNLTPANIAVADLNGDGKLDVVVGNVGPNGNGSLSVSVLLNNGSGGLNAPMIYPAGFTTDCSLGCHTLLRLGDLTGNNRPAIVLTESESQNSNPIAVLHNNGDGTFAAAVTYAVSSNASDIAIGDLNGDNHLDLVAVSGGTVAVLLNNGNGTFASPVYYPVAGDSLAVGIVDVTLDDKPDIVTLGHYGSETVLPGNGDGTFPTIAYPAGTSGTLADVAVADITGDGKPDLIAIDANLGSPGTLVLERNDGHGNFAPLGAPLTLPEPAYTLAAADFTGHGKTDLAVAGDGPPVTVRILTGNGMGAFVVGAPLPLPANAFPVTLVAADLGNGHQDLVIADGGNSTVDILWNDGTGAFTLKPTAAIGGNPQAVAVGDVGNGHLDIAVTRADGKVAVFLGDGTGAFTAAPGSPISVGSGGANASAGSVALADVNGDHKADLIVVSTTRGTSSLDTVSVLLSNGNGTFAAPLALPVDPYSGTGPNSYGPLVLADLNGDGIPDIAVGNRCGGQTPRSFNCGYVSLYPGKGDGTFAAPSTAVLPANGTALQLRAADVNGDGRIDLIGAGSFAAPYTGSTTYSGMLGVLRNITLSPSAAAHLIFGASPPASVNTGQPFGVAVAAVDANGTVVNGFAGAITINLRTGAGLGGTLTQTAAGGVAVFTGLTDANVGGGLTLTATSGALTGGSLPFNVLATNVNPQPARHMAVPTAVIPPQPMSGRHVSAPTAPSLPLPQPTRH